MAGLAAALAGAEQPGLAHGDLCAEDSKHLTGYFLDIEVQNALLFELWSVKPRHTANTPRQRLPSPPRQGLRQRAALTDPAWGDDIVLGALASQCARGDLASEAGRCQKIIAL